MKRVAHLLLFAGWLAPAASAQDHLQIGAYGDHFSLDHVMVEREVNYDVDGALTQTSTSSTSAPTVVQHKSTASENASGLTVTLNANIGPGHLLVVGASTHDAETINPPTDADGDTFVLAVRSDNTSGGAVNAVYYVPSTKGGHNSVTCHISATDNLHCAVYEFSGALASAPLDQIGSGVGSGASLSVTTAGPLAQPNEYVVAYFSDNNNSPTWTVGTGYGDTEVTNTGGDTGFSEDAIIASATQKTATATSSTHLNWAGSIATFKVAAAGTVPPVKLTVSGSVLFDDGTTVLVGPVTVLQQQTPQTLGSAGTVSLDASGTLSGSISVDPSFADGNGNVTLQLGIPTVPGAVSYTIPMAELQQGSTGLKLNVVIFRKVLLPKSLSASLVP
jgi:hypothetical protein